MLSLAHAPLTRITQQVAAVFALPRTAPTPAAADSLRRSRIARRNETSRRAAPIFTPLLDGPAARVRDPEADWLHLAMHYRPCA
jgi:hypothetical protein